MTTLEKPTKPEDLPVPSAHGELLDVYAEAFIAVLPKKKGERWLREVAVILARRTSLGEVLPLRGHASHEARMKALAGAVALFRQALPVLLARVSRR